ncbi:PREDICTED: hematopoietic lineage cell-specific protein-like isoform X3 [Poecilia mexicana]|uniref:hematopoietic lineage cell-specific protein-like isoform X3 n=1 Tax=Poecilia mexicana TaxID=48701 RepID=UPI00072DA7FC|nr:PREDICTED: hematopoietic lineage cell-specific protein-like isoform X3 [Poecilia mexicana]
MWKSVVGHDVNVKVAAEGDDWETDPDFENDVSEQEQRWGAKSIEGSGRKEHISVAELRNRVAQEHEQVKQKDQTPKASYGYGGKFGVEKDRMDKVAMGHDYVAQVEQHSSQKDMAKGFGGKFGVQKDRVDKSAMGFEYKGEVQQHASQKDYAKGFGGKYGVEKEKVDKAALGYDYKGETDKHQSQKDYAAGFGGRYGVQTDRMDKSAAGFSDMDSPTSAYEKTQPVEASSAGAGKLKARFENMAKASDEENRKKVEEERARRQARESREREEAKRRQQEEDSRKQEVHPPPAQEEPTYDNPPVETHRNFPAVPKTPEPEPEGDELYEEPPDLPPRSDDLLEPVDPPLPPRSAAVDEVEDGGVYDELSETPAPEPEEDGGEYEDVSAGQRAVAIYDYEGEADDEISFNPDDVITNIEMIDEGWWKGHCHGRTGLFPASYVQLQ